MVRDQSIRRFVLVGEKQPFAMHWFVAFSVVQDSLEIRGYFIDSGRSVLCFDRNHSGGLNKVAGPSCRHGQNRSVGFSPGKLSTPAL